MAFVSRHGKAWCSFMLWVSWMLASPSLNIWINVLDVLARVKPMMLWLRSKRVHVPCALFSSTHWTRISKRQQHQHKKAKYAHHHGAVSKYLQVPAYSHLTKKWPRSSTSSMQLLKFMLSVWKIHSTNWKSQLRKSILTPSNFINV